MLNKLIILTTTDVLAYIKRVKAARKEQLSWYTDLPTTDLDDNPKAKARFIKHLQKELKDLDKAYRIIKAIDKPFKI